MKVTNTSRKDSVLVLWRVDGRSDTFSMVLRPGHSQDWSDGTTRELLGTYKLVQVTKLVDDPSVVEVEE